MVNPLVNKRQKIMSKKELTDTITNRLAAAHDKITSVAQTAGRNADEIKLMAVSKTKPTDYIVAAYEQGQRIFGENYAQELHQKWQQLDMLEEIEWHYIGPIQSNKTAIIAEAASWIDSVDRLKIAKRLSTHAVSLNKSLNILLQVNISGSDSKSGVSLAEVNDLASEVYKLPQLNLRGLMAIPDQYDDNEQLIKEFNLMNGCFSELQQQYPSVDTLSLGMSADLTEAVSHGSTLVRLGTAIFGAR